MHVYLTVAAAVWGIVAGVFAVPRAAYRLAVGPDEPWRSDVRGWIGPGPGGVALGLFTAAACGAVAVSVGPRPEVVVWLLLVPVGVLLARVDLAVFRLPDVLTVPAAPVTAVLLAAVALLPGSGGSWVRALLGAVVLGGLYLVLFLVNPRGMGFGDVKLAPTVGLVLGWYGWPALFTGTFAAFVLGAVAGLALLAAGRADRRTPIPFGPFMLIGALGGVLSAAS